MTVTETSTAVDRLRRRLRGDVIEPAVAAGTPRRRRSTSPSPRPRRSRPSRRTSATSPTIVAFAREHGLQVAPQRTGHNAEPLGALDDVILVKTDRAPGRRDRRRAAGRARRAGSKWGDVVPRASELGLAALHGSTPDVSVAGYSLGGGVGWYARKHGLSTNSVIAIELVTADGALRRVDHENEPELFWALRGGGGNFGVVTALEVAAVRDPRGLRRRAVLPVGAVGRGAARLARVDADRAGRGHVGRPDPPVPAAPRAARVPPRPERSPSSRPSFIGGEADGAELLAPAARARRRRSTRSRWCRRSASPSCTWIRPTRSRTPARP